MKSAYLLPTVHIALTHSVVWAFFVALSLLAIECVVIARSNRQPRRATPVVDESLSDQEFR